MLPLTLVVTGADRGVDGMLYFYDLVGTDSTPSQTSLGKKKVRDAVEHPYPG